MLGAELAALLKWPALVAGLVVLVWLARKWIRAGAVSDERAEQAAEAQEQERAAQQEIEDEEERLLARWARGLRK